MPTRRLLAALGEQRGIALPMALIALVILAALVVAFSVLSASEPTIANNHMRVTQARALAEAGLERAIWGLNNPGASGGLPDPLPSPVPAPYDGSQFVSVSDGSTPIGGFRVTVAAGAVATERSLTAVGWVPSEAASPGRAHQRITSTLTRIRWVDPPCALCVRGDLQISGTSRIDSRLDNSCGAKKGVVTTGLTAIGSAAAQVYGYGDPVPNQSGDDIVMNESTSNFDQFTFSDDELQILKSIAKSRGTYYQGAVTFNASNRMPDGLIFIDTTTGAPMSSSTPDSEMGVADISGNAGGGASNSWNGWLVVNGSIRVNGNVQLNGLVYAVNDLYYAGTGTGNITGAVISTNRKDIVASTIDTTAIGNSAINYNCNAARTGNNLIPQGWFVKAGTYKEIPD